MGRDVIGHHDPAVDAVQHLVAEFEKHIVDRRPVSREKCHPRTAVKILQRIAEDLEEADACEDHLVVLVVGIDEVGLLKVTQQIRRNRVSHVFEERPGQSFRRTNIAPLGLQLEADLFENFELPEHVILIAFAKRRKIRQLFVKKRNNFKIFLRRKPRDGGGEGDEAVVLSVTGFDGELFCRLAHRLLLSFLRRNIVQGPIYQERKVCGSLIEKH